MTEQALHAGNTAEQALAELYDSLPPDIAKRVVSPSETRRRMLSRRNSLIRATVGELYPWYGWGFAGQLTRDMNRFLRAAHMRSPERENKKQSKLRALADACGGHLPRIRMLQDIIAGRR